VTGFVRGLTALASAVTLLLPASATAGKVSVAPGPRVPVVVQRGPEVLLPGGKQIRLAVSRDYGACESFLSLSRDGRWLAWTTPTGALRVVDLRVRKAYSLGTGCDPTWGPDGRLAYLVVAQQSAAGNSYRSAIVVRRSPLGAGTVWARGQLWGLTWVGKSLAYQRFRATFPHTSLVLAGRPMTGRVVLGTGGKHNDPLLIAASPDGRRLVVQVDRTVRGTLRTYEDLVDTSTLRVLSELDPQGFQGLGRGVWSGDQVVAPQGGALGGTAHPRPELIRMSTTGDRLRLQQVRNLDATSDGLFDWLDNLQATGHGTIAVTHYRRTATLLSCRIATLACTTVLDLG
jgi:hypothetical protein